MSNNVLVLTESTEFEEAISLLDDNGNGVLPVVGTDNKFIGLVTDGDIRKAILNKQLDLEHIINKHPYKLNINTTHLQRLQYLKLILRRQLPLVDDDGFYVDLFVLDDLEFNAKPNSVVIMAGGLGSRLGELTKNTPKPMLHVGNKPILEIILENFIDHGFFNFYISVNFKSEKIMEYFEDGKKWGVKIKYLHESKRLGTAGALSLIKEELQDPFIVSNGDVITTLNFDDVLKFHYEKNSMATMCVREHEYNVPYGVIEGEDDRIFSMEEKPSMKFEVNAGIYVLNPELIKSIPGDTFYDMPSLFEQLIEKKEETYMYKLTDYWVDIGMSDEFARANDDLLDYK